jgi:hypothetical protein
MIKQRMMKLPNILALAVFPLKLNSRGLSRLAFVAVLALTGASSLSHPASAGFKQLGTHGRSEILSACQASGGDFYNNDGGYGAYGCHTSKGSVNCDDNGNCVGHCDNCSDALIKLKAGPVRVKNPPTTVGPPTREPRPVHPVKPVGVSNPNKTDSGNGGVILLREHNGSGGRGHGH